jgi:intein/homing endonuclease
VRLPPVDDLDLAYETGLHIGDGCLSRYFPYHYRYVLSDNRLTEREYYNICVIPLLEGLYGLRSHLYEYRNSILATITSKPLVLFKSNEIGLPIGRKDKLRHLPPRILQQGTRRIANLLSGLYDADGSVKTRKTPSGNYPRISIAQKVKGIIEDTKRILLEDFQITSTSYNNDYYDVRVDKVETRWFLDINGYSNLERFSECIGTRHPVFTRKIRALLSARP